jgi:hypothetical protein
VVYPDFGGETASFFSGRHVCFSRQRIFPLCRENFCAHFTSAGTAFFALGTSRGAFPKAWKIRHENFQCLKKTPEKFPSLGKI